MTREAGQAKGVALPSPAVQTALWCVVGAVAVTAVISTSGPLREPAVGWPVAAALAALSLFAALQGVWVTLRPGGGHAQETIDLDEVTLVVLLFLLEGPAVLVITLTAYTVALLVDRPEPLKATFNIASRTTSVSLAVAIASPVLAAPVTDLTPWTVLVVAGAVLAHIALNFVSVKLVVAAARGVSLWSSIRATASLNVVMWVGNVTLGIGAAALWFHHPVLIVVAVALAAIIRRAYQTVVVVNDLNEDLRLERDRLRRLVDGARDGILELDADGAVVVWNPALEQLTGISMATAAGAELDRLMAGRVVIDEGAATIAAIVTGGAPPDDQVLRISTPEGERSLVARHALQHDREGTLVGDIIQLHDRTAMERTARVQHDFLARVTHELLTPVTVIRGVTETVLARGDALDAAIRQQLLGRLGMQVTHMEGLVHDLLAVNATRRRPGRAQPEAHDLWSIVEDAVATERGRWEGRTIELTGCTATAALEPSALHTVVRHLVRNALNYSPDDAPVSVTLDPPDPTHAVLRVQDAGRGIPSSRLDEMFAPFTRIEDPLRMETRGIGLGLFLVRQLVTEIGGTVRVTSDPGRGSTFEVRLPCKAPAHSPVTTEHG